MRLHFCGPWWSLGSFAVYSGSQTRSARSTFPLCGTQPESGIPVLRGAIPECYATGAVVVHGAYLSSLQRAALETEKDSGDLSPHAVLLSQLTEVQSHLSRDSLRSAASQLMYAVMGMRKLWLSTSRYSIATQNSLLALPFRMGSTLFPGAQQVVREAADAVASFKDSKALLEQPRPSRSRAPGPGLSSTSVGPTPAPAQWLQPLGRGKRKTRRSKGKGKGAGGAQQPFRGRGRSAQASL